MVQNTRFKLNGAWFRPQIGSLLLLLVIFVLSFWATAWRIDQAPDIFTDEILYTRAGVRVAGEGALVWDSGRPLLIHPPLYFVAEAAYLTLTGGPLPPLEAAGDIFASVYHARYLNAIFTGLTSVLLYVVGRRLHGRGLGLLLVALFVLDPFGLRINRRAMLETLAALWVLAGLAVLLSGKLSRSRAVVAGLLFGAALLTKELTLITLVAVLLYGLWEALRGRRMGDAEGKQAGEAAFWTVAVALLTYAFYPLWMLASDNWTRFAEVKGLGLQRLLGLVQLSGWNRPGVSLVDFVAARLADYGSSYLLLALGGAAALWLLWHHRQEPGARFLAALGLVLYPFFGLVALFGSGNDQFFYLLLVPALVLVGYALVTLPGRAGGTLRWPVPAAIALLILVLPYNAAQWWTAYGIGRDAAYRQLAAYVEAFLPPGETLNASGDSLKYLYFFPERPITAIATPEEGQALGVRYYALAPKDVKAQYGRTTPELADWLAAQGQLLYVAPGNSYGDVYLYRLDQGNGLAAQVRTHEARPRLYPFAPAQSGFVTPLLVVLAVWSAMMAGVAAWLARRRGITIRRQTLHRDPTQCSNC